jgi:antitoxin (DNA-binding transcriptional repressor) of toxin-antitoxin stability system
MASFVAFPEAQEKLAELLTRAQGGEEIIIEYDGGVSARLVAIQNSKTKKVRRIGGQNLLGITYIAPDFDAPMSDAELAEWGY